MPFELRPITPDDTLSWVRVRSLAYYGPTHECIHNGAVSDSSVRRIAEDWKEDLKKLNNYHWRVVDTNLEPSEDDPPTNGGRTIAIAVWSVHNAKAESSNEPVATPSLTTTKSSFVPPELRIDALSSLLGPLRAAQPEIMGTSEPYLMLNMLATHPDHQGRGAGKVLLDWGLKKADDEGLVTYLSATGVGRRMYEKRGFEVVKTIEWDRVPWGGEGKDCHWCMVRQPQKEKV
jgi:ribosomal protein S18 acetylase RimI-like enzyme